MHEMFNVDEVGSWLVTGCHKSSLRVHILNLEEARANQKELPSSYNDEKVNAKIYSHHAFLV